MKKATFLLWFLAQTLCFGQQYSIDWHKIAGGGGTGAGGNFTVSGAIGQPDASAPMNGGSFSLTGGFWVVAQTEPFLGEPALYIASAGGAVIIFWQDSAGWSLQQNANLAAPAGWSAAGGWSLLNGTNYLTIPNPSGNWFYRLKHG
jgi:hypothetical protein